MSDVSGAVDTNAQLNNDATVSSSVAPGASSADTPATTTGPADTAASGQPTEGEGTQPDKPTRDRRAEKRIASLTRKNEELLTRLGRLEGIVEVTTRPQQATEQPNARPQLDQFKSYDEYVEALTDWKTDQKLEAREKAREEKARNQSVDSKATERNARVAERLMEDAKDVEDFEEVMETITARNFPISEAMRDYLEEAERPALMAQWLADNRDRAKQIYSMNSAAAVRELDKVAASFAPKPARTSSAPPPVPTVGGRSVTTRDPKDMDMTEYASAWNARRASKH